MQSVFANSGNKITGSSAATTCTLTPTTIVSIVMQSHSKLTSDPAYFYKMKIINPNKKKLYCSLSLNDFSTTFDSMTFLRVKLVETFKSKFLTHLTSM